MTTRWLWLVALATVAMMSGCFEPPSPYPSYNYDPYELVGPYHPTEPLNFTAIYVEGFPPNPLALSSGGIGGCFNLKNPNNQTTWYDIGVQYYQVIPEGTGEKLTLVAQEIDGADFSPLYANHEGRGTLHHPIPLNETENGSTKYAIHLWTDITDHVEPYPVWSPPLHSEKWINVTYTMTGGGLYHEGGSC